MRQGATCSINHSSKYPSLWLLAAAICLNPAAAAPVDVRNTATGTGALYSVTSGINNTADGYYALFSNTTGNGNTASGSDALFSNTTGNWNTANGTEALYNNSTGNWNTANGYRALYNNTTANSNNANGTQALYANTTGYNNSASGTNTLYSNTTGYNNTANGTEALYYNTTGDSNTASGVNALHHNTTGWDNTAIGISALQSNTSGHNNTASGTGALIANTTGSYNTASGFYALRFNTTGSNNVAVGTSALYAINGSNNIALGTEAGKNTTSGSTNIYIGHQGINGSENRVIRIGQGQKKTFIAGISGTALSGATVVVNSQGRLGVIASSARYKQDIKPLGSAAEKLDQLRPVSYRYKTEPEATHYGLIAEEVDKVMPELVVRDEQNRPETVQYHELIPLLLQQWKAQQAEIARQKAEIAELRQMLARRFAALNETNGTDRAGGRE